MTEIFQDYKAFDITSEAFIAYEGDAPKPAVMICHAWAGQGEFDQNIARKLAKLGYVGIALDVYGKGNRGDTTEECTALMSPLVEDRQKLQNRLLSSVEFVESLKIVDTKNIAVIGFCFGGMCALDIARSGTDKVKAAIAFHGLFTPNNLDNKGPIKAKVLALHGYDDPMATPENMVALCNELTERDADWQMHAFGGTMHAYTNPHANAPQNGMLYNPKSAKRAFALMEYHLKEVFSD